jgi:hypothetical protein
VINWGSTAVRSPTLDSRLVFSIIKLSEAVHSDDDPTLQTVYSVLKWSLNALSEGYFPWKDHEDREFSETYFPERFEKRGKPLAGGYCGAFAEVRGDWKFLRETFYLEQHYGTNYICHLCRAHKKIVRNKFTDFSRSAHHRTTLVDSLAWWTSYVGGKPVSPLVYVVGFNVYRIVFDLMHTLDLGMMQDCASSVLWQLTEAKKDGGVWDGDSTQDRFNAAYIEYSAWVKRQRLPAKARRFKSSQWRRGDRYYPSISQLVMKAAMLRSFQYFLLEACLKPAAMETEVGCIRAAMMREFVAADEVMRRAGKFLTLDQRAKLIDHFESALVSYNWLSSWAESENLVLYPVKPKCHALLHIGLDFGMNPRQAVCMLDEDMVGRCKRLYNGCHGSSAPKRSLERYLIIVGLRWIAALRNFRIRAIRNRAG